MGVGVVDCGFVSPDSRLQTPGLQVGFVKVVRIRCTYDFINKMCINYLVTPLPHG